MSMTGAFKEGTGGLFGPSDLNSLIVAITAAVLLVWVAWIIVGAYQGYSSGQLSSQELPIRVLRAVCVMMVLFVLLIL